MSPECLFVLDNYNDYISGELEPDKVRQVEEHIKACPNCDIFIGRALKTLVRTVELLRISAPVDLKNSITTLLETL